MDMKYIAIGVVLGLIVGYVRISKGGGRTPSTPGIYG